jgi:hypothetical protein
LLGIAIPGEEQSNYSNYQYFHWMGFKTNHIAERQFS